MESQLLIERKLARQHVDTKIAEQQQQMKHLEEEQNTAPMRPPLANRQLGSYKNINETVSSVLSKDQVNLPRPLSENNSWKLPMPLHPADGFLKHIDPTEKENILEMAEQTLPKRTGRASICNMARRIPAPPAPRRSSLIPFPSAPSSATLPLPLLPIPPCQADKKEDTSGSEANNLPEQTPSDSPKKLKIGGTKKLSSILRRSLQRKIQMKSPMQQHMRKVGVNVGMEKVRVSIGSRGRMGHRVLLGSNTRAGGKESQQKQIRREKERGWNIGGAVGRTGI